MIVIKIGGTNIDNKKILNNIINNIIQLSRKGHRIILVHGGSKQIDREMLKQKIKIVKILGKRYTDEKTIRVLDKCCKIINDKLSNMLNRGKNIYGFGLHGGSNFLLTAQKEKAKPDLGLVGKISNILIDELLCLSHFCIPIISPVVMDKSKKLYNINADDVAESIATSIKADKLIFVSDIDGVVDNKGEIISFINFNKAKKLIDSNIISGGMLPKIKSCMKAIQSGISSISIINGRHKDVLLKTILYKAKLGTTIKSSALKPT